MPFTPTPTIGDDVLTDTTGDESVDALAVNDQIAVTRGIQLQLRFPGLSVVAYARGGGAMA